MSRAPKMIFAGVVALLVVACNLFMPSAPTAQSPATSVPPTDTQAPPPPTAISSSTASPLPPTPEATATPSPAPSDTALPTFTATARPVPSDTVVPTLATATAPSAAFGAVPTANASQLALFGPSAMLMGISQYYNPVGTPLQSWHDVPIMSQAIAGQEFNAFVYSYRATATLSQAVQYYSARAKAIGLPDFPPATGYGGTGAMAFHSTTWLTHNIAVVVTSLDNDPQHVIVVIAKS